MKILIAFAFMAIQSLFTFSCKEEVNQDGKEMNASIEDSAKAKTLIVYYSWSGTTKQVAQTLQKKTGCDIYEILPVVAYPTDDNATHYQAVEERESGNLPALKGTLPDLSGYDLILLGGPV